MHNHETTATAARRSTRLAAIVAAVIIAWLAVEPAANAAPLPTATSRSVKAYFSTPDVLTGEMGWLRGQVRVNGKLTAKVKVTIERRTPGSSWKAIGSTATGSVGSFMYGFYPGVKYEYRARITGTSTVSSAQSVAWKSGGRTLEEREAVTKWRLGAAKTSIHAIEGSDLPSSADSGRYRVYEKATLVEVVTGGVPKTWLVESRTFTKYTQLGKWTGKLGVPLRDARCGLLEGGCVQRFHGGALYQNTAKMSPGVYVAYGSRVETELLAVGYSQVGYEEPSWRVNKYTAWLGSRPAWCMTWVAWVATASGNGGMVPKSSSYANYVKALKASGRLHYSGVPPTGAAVLYDWGTGTPSHTGLVTSRSGNYLYTLEGNTTDGSGDPQRGVYHRKRALSHVWAWYMPSES